MKHLYRIAFVIMWLWRCSFASYKEEEGYYLDTLQDTAAVVAPETLQCPSSNVITARYKCQVDGQWVDCSRKHCCPDYVYISGKCVSKDVDPCSLQLCEQRCTVYLQRVICTCFPGYKFNPENQRKNIKPVCEDINECLDNNGDCEHICLNNVGSHHCGCREGFKLRADNRTCELVSEAWQSGVRGPANQAATRDRCYANCDTVLRLHNKVNSLQEKLLALSTAIRLSSFASGPPGPAGRPGPPGPQGPRGFPGNVGDGPSHSSSAAVSTDDFTYSIIDSYVTTQGSSGNNFCKCKRGALGPSGAMGKEGPKGATGDRGLKGQKGSPGSFDFMLLLLADIRHDIHALQQKVFSDKDPPLFDLHSTLKEHRKEQKRLEKQNRLLQGHTAPSIERTKWHKIISDPEEFKDLSLLLLEDYDESEASGEDDAN